MMTKRLLAITICFLVSLITIGQVSPKRGSAYGFHSVNDLTTLSNGLSWWYNWSDDPDAAVETTFDTIGVEFVPMFWNNNFDINEAIANIPASAKYILAYNEPNFTVESNISPQDAANNWWRIEQVAAARSLEIVSASPAYCGGGVCMSGYSNPIDWHNDFFAACPDCKVDYIAFHNYESTVGGLLALTNNLKVYGLPIWVTEFALWDEGVSNADKITYLQQAVSAFENDPDIFRYSWFTGRSGSNSTINLLAGDGVLTSLGTEYVNATYPAAFDLPTDLVQAEDYYRRRGTGTETTSDIGGGDNVGWTDAGTWGEYLVDISTTGSYNFNFRVASNVGTGLFSILLDGDTVKNNIAVPNTGGWQAWQDLVVNDIVLTSGDQKHLKLVFKEGGTNLNHFQAFYQSAVPPEADFSASTISTCVSNQIELTDETNYVIGDETYSWNFGAGASPTTATGEGPHTISYTTGGQKTVSLTVTNSNGTHTETKTNYITIASPTVGCLFEDEFNDNTVAHITPIAGAFTHSEPSTNWNLSTGGHGEWEFFNYTLNDGTNPLPLNFSCAINKPILKVRAKASDNCLLKISLMDENARSIDALGATNLELTTAFQVFTIDYAGNFENVNSGNPGVLDSSAIDRLEMIVNPGFANYPYTGTNGTYDESFIGTIDIDWIGIGDNCPIPPLSDQLTNFSVAEITGGTQLDWTMETESDKDEYEVQRSYDGTNFATIGTVQSLGNSTVPVNYSYDDLTPLSATTYYRLKIIDLDANFVYSEVVSISPVSVGVEEDVKVSVQISSDGTESIVIRSSELLGIVEIRNVVGQLVCTMDASNNKEVLIDRNDISANQGIYILTIKDSGVREKVMLR